MPVSSKFDDDRPYIPSFDALRCFLGRWGFLARSRLRINHIEGDLFNAPKDNSLAHAVDKTFRMSKGIASKFNERYGSREYLLRQEKGVGECAVLNRNKYSKVVYIVTKHRHSHKPSPRFVNRFERDYIRGLIGLKDTCLRLSISKLAIPRIGSGLDGLDWDACILPSIRGIFADLDMEINIYSPPSTTAREVTQSLTESLIQNTTTTETVESVDFTSSQPSSTPLRTTASITTVNNTPMFSTPHMLPSGQQNSPYLLFSPITPSSRVTQNNPNTQTLNPPTPVSTNSPHNSPLFHNTPLRVLQTSNTPVSTNPKGTSTFSASPNISHLPHGNFQQVPIPIHSSPTLIPNNIHPMQQQRQYYIPGIPPPMQQITPQRLEDALLLISSARSNYVPHYHHPPPLMQYFPQGLPL